MSWGLFLGLLVGQLMAADSVGLLASGRHVPRRHSADDVQYMVVNEPSAQLLPAVHVGHSSYPPIHTTSQPTVTHLCYGERIKVLRDESQIGRFFVEVPGQLHGRWNSVMGVEGYGFLQGYIPSTTDLLLAPARPAEASFGIVVRKQATVYVPHEKLEVLLPLGSIVQLTGSIEKNKQPIVWNNREIAQIDADSILRCYQLPDEEASSRRMFIQLLQELYDAAYMPGGRSAIDGCDEGGLLHLAMHALGFSVPRSAHEQIELSVAISPHELLPGDLIYFASNDPRLPSRLMVFQDGDVVVEARRDSGVSEYMFESRFGVQLASITHGQIFNCSGKNCRCNGKINHQYQVYCGRLLEPERLKWARGKFLEAINQPIPAQPKESSEPKDDEWDLL